MQKKYLVIAIIFAVFAFVLGHTTNCQCDKNPITHTYETDDTNFKQGEILLPDYIHPLDTLIVTDPEFLNKWIADYNVSSDGDIMDILRVSTKKY